MFIAVTLETICLTRDSKNSFDVSNYSGINDVVTFISKMKENGGRNSKTSDLTFSVS